MPLDGPPADSADARRLRGLRMPARADRHPSPVDWRDEILYFLLPDRFSDGREGERPLLDRSDLTSARPDGPNHEPWRWDRWAESGASRFQGGTIAGVTSKLEYLAGLGVTAIWVGPIFKQRARQNSYHGYGIQNFLAVDPRFGDADALVSLVDAAHARGIRVILDIIFNHSGPNWRYRDDAPGGPDTPRYTTGRYPFGAWRGPHDELVAPPEAGAAFDSIDAAVWPQELQDVDRYTRAGAGDLGAGDINDPNAEHKRSDFITLRDFNLDAQDLLGDLARCYKFWIALTDCDGFRIDTLKHVTLEQARNFCGTIKEFAAQMGKDNFLLIGEIAGGDANEERYLEALERNLDAALDIGEMRLAITGAAKGLRPPSAYFDGFAAPSVMGSHRNIGGRHISIVDDHDHVFGEKVRFSADASSTHQISASAALQLFTLGIPCLYYGSEQALSGPEPSERVFLPGWGGSDRYLREALFGPTHPLSDASSAAAPAPDPALPGFGAFGTAGRHVFDTGHEVYRRIAALTAARSRFPVLRKGRQYPRPISIFGEALHPPDKGELIAWSRILDDQEALCIVNGHGVERRGADVLVDATLNPEGSTMAVVVNSESVTTPTAPNPPGLTLTVRRRPDGAAVIEVRNVGPSETLILLNRV